MTTVQRAAPTAALDEKVCDDHRRLGGLVAAGGAGAMITGAIVNTIIGLDLDAALADDTMADYLRDASDSTTAMMVNFSLWIAGALLMSLGVTLLSHSVPPSPASTIARFGAAAGAGAVVVFFPLMIGLVLGLEGKSELESAGVALGQAATIADWIATVLILSVGAGGVALAGRDDWVPRWLVRVAQVTMALGIVTIVGLVLGANAIGVPLVVVGLLLVLSLGVSAVRSA